jgi:hypothetical protein
MQSTEPAKVRSGKMRLFSSFYEDAPRLVVTPEYYTLKRT